MEIVNNLRSKTPINPPDNSDEITTSTGKKILSRRSIFKLNGSTDCYLLKFNVRIRYNNVMIVKIIPINFKKYFISFRKKIRLFIDAPIIGKGTRERERKKLRSECSHLIYRTITENFPV